MWITLEQHIIFFFNLMQQNKIICNTECNVRLRTTMHNITNWIISQINWPLIPPFFILFFHLLIRSIKAVHMGRILSQMARPRTCLPYLLNFWSSGILFVQYSCSQMILRMDTYCYYTHTRYKCACSRHRIHSKCLHLHECINVFVHDWEIL